jgi:hypothetical protein
MSEVILSPGVFQIESDQSLYTQAPQTLGAAVVGPTVGGRPFVPTYVTTYSQYQSIFGDVFKSGSYYYEYFTSQVAREYFNNGGQTLLVTRIVSSSANVSTYASSDVITQTSVGSVAATGSVAVTTTFMTSSNQEVRINYGSTVYRFIATDPTTIPQDDVDGNVYYFSTGSTATSGVNNLTGSINRALSGSAASASVNIVTATATGGTTLILSGSLLGTYANGITLASGSGASFSTQITLAGGANTITQAASFTLETLDWGDTQNNTSSLSSGSLASGSSYNVRWEVTNVNTGSNGGTFTIVVRRGDDNDSQKNILETWANVSLDPQLPNYISRVIGDLKPVYVAASGANSAYIRYDGTYANASKYVRVKSVTTPNVDSIDNNGNFKTATYGTTLPIVGSGSYGGSFAGGTADTTAEKKMNENITATNIQGFAPSDYNTAFSLLSNKDEYQFNILLAPGVGLDCSAASNIISTVEGRGDAIAILGAGIYGTSITAATQNAAGQSSNYAAAYYPWVQLYSSALGRVAWCPPSTVMGGVLAFNDQVGAEWFAPAGLNRGGIPSVIRAEKRLSQTDRDTLYTGNINPLATFPGTGVCVWGQKTLQRKPTALDRVNVRRLLIALKGYIGNVSRTLVFEQNTTVTRNRFLAQVNPYLSSVVQRQGLYAYKVVMDESNNTPDVVDRNQLVGQIYIQPTKTAEFIILNFNILPTGATFPA